MEISNNATQPVSELTSGVTSAEGPSPTQTNASHDIDAETCVEQPDVQMEDDPRPEPDDDAIPSETSPQPAPPAENPPTPAQSQVTRPVTFPKGPARKPCPNICGDSSDDEEKSSKSYSRSNSPMSVHEDEPCSSKQLITSTEGSAPKNYGTYAGRPRDYSRSPSSSEDDYPVKKSKPSEETTEALASLVEQASLVHSEKQPEFQEQKSQKVAYQRQDTEWKRKTPGSSRETQQLRRHPWASLLGSRLAPVESAYYNTDLDASDFEQIPPSGYSGLVEGLFLESTGSIPRSLRSNVTILEAVGPTAIENFRQSNQYEGLEELRRTKKPLPTMPLKKQAVGDEKNAYVHGLVFDNDGTAPVLYRIKSLFGSGAKLESVHFEVPFPDRLDLQIITLDQFAINIKTEKRGIDITKLIVGDLIWVYSLAVTTRFASTKMQAPRMAATAAQLREPTVWRVARFALIHRELRPTLGFVLNIVNAKEYTFRICMQGHRQLVTVNRNRMENPADFPKIRANSFIVAPFRSRQLDYMIFACPPKQQNELMSDIPYLQSPPPAPAGIRNNSEEHQKLIESKLDKFDLFQSRPQEVLDFLEPLYSTACGAITAAIADSTDLATHYTIWTSPDLNSFPIKVQFRIPIRKKTGWAVGHTIRGAYEADFLDGQISNIQMGNGFLTVTAKLTTSSGVRLRTYLINSRNRRISVGTTLHTIDERANPVLKMLEGATLSTLLRTNTLGWTSARAMLAGDVEITGINTPERASITVNVDGIPVHLNDHQVSAVNMFNKNYPILVVDSAYGAGKSLCTAVMAQEAVRKGEKILVAAVQNSAPDVIGLKIAQLQSDQIRPVRYVNDLMANDPSNTSPFALQVLMENFHETHRHLLSDRLYNKFRNFSDSRREMREFMFSGI
ncbi:hypothetical protein Y032_0042g652 [Ancylostoma ceylanicum]|uniref:DNA2/NAM7 helicase helicase domain-containing protein n=2 Tax=Ancylostoma ceylanicum TaxID=53326 RepID=A0A016UFS2_9BILA|nr:hypothetical protein Y032_0042g652 [Ancylostoma ceylanicum]